MRNIALILSLGLLIVGCGPSEEEKRKEEALKRQADRDSVSSCVSRVMSACDRDPVFTYCGIKWGNNVIGSGCTSQVKNKPISERAEFCKSGIRYEAERDCEIQVYGCAAVTGDINC